MADPFSAVAAAAGLADVVFRTSRGLYEDLEELREVPDDVENLSDSLVLWTKICRNVKDMAQRYEASPFARVDGSSTDVICEALRSCEDACSTIDALVKAHKTASKFKLGKNIKWMLNGKRRQAAHSRLDQSQQSLIVALNALSRLDYFKDMEEHL